MANSDDRYEMLPFRELCKLSWVVRAAALSSALDVRLMTALQVLQVTQLAEEVRETS